MNRNLFLAAAAIALTLSGCASRPATRAEYSSLPPLESGWSRVYLSAGNMYAKQNLFSEKLVSVGKLWSVNQVGPVFINDQRVGTNAKDEHLVVDLRPGTYEAYCTPEEPEKTFTEKRQFTFIANETRYLACDMEPKGVGMYFGLIGGLASEHLTKSYLQGRPIDQNSKLISYKKLQTPLDTLSATPAALQAPPSSDTATQKIRELHNLRNDKIITEEEFQKKKQQLLEKL